MTEMSALERELRQRCRDDYPFFAERCLKIRPRTGGALVPFVFNIAQKFLHAALQTQLKQTGMVRAIIVKGRQEGVSTYVEGRFYHKVTHTGGTKAFILTHMGDATDNLFEMVERFHANNNILLKPQTSHANAKELKFNVLDSGYAVGTAGSSGGVGRSDTIQLFHASEVAFWKDPEAIMSGLGQTVPKVPGTEIVLESTAQGLGGYFSDAWSQAVRGETEYLPIFIPWFWEPSYCAPITVKGPAMLTPDKEGRLVEVELTREEIEYGEAFSLSPGQLLWRRSKIIELKKPGMFDQEYPATPELAFQASGEGSFITPVSVMRARKARVQPPRFVPLVLGIDPARGGGDKTGVIDRQGRRAGANICVEWDDADLMVTCGKIVKLIRTLHPLRVFIDTTGLGAGIYDRLMELNYGNIVHPVNFSSEASLSEHFWNQRAEMWDNMRAWFSDVVPVQVPDIDALQQAITAPIWGKGKTRFMSNGALCLEPKESIRERHRSPDLADALALTFAIPTGAYANIIPPQASSGSGGDRRVGY